jgi:hypothetical protein
MWFDPSWVLLRRSAVFMAVSFSKVTSADLVSPVVVTLKLAILPLQRVLKDWFVRLFIP